MSLREDTYMCMTQSVVTPTTQVCKQKGLVDIPFENDAIYSNPLLYHKHCATIIFFYAHLLLSSGPINETWDHVDLPLCQTWSVGQVAVGDISTEALMHNICRQVCIKWNRSDGYFWLLYYEREFFIQVRASYLSLSYHKKERQQREDRSKIGQSHLKETLSFK